ncbi:MAG TPA: DNA polymerase Y family protein [Puia sp.]|nr:DNA polymerase Y family protein [Puia sp.]
MEKRFVSIWFPHLTTDWFTLRQPELKNKPFVLRAPAQGRMIITAANGLAEAKGIYAGMVLADARAIFPDLQVRDDNPGLAGKLLRKIAEWCIRFTPQAAVDPPDGIMLDISGCAHLWGGDEPYLAVIQNRFHGRGYQVRLAVADTIGAAWAVARFGQGPRIVKKGMHTEALLALSPAALRLEKDTVERLYKLGLRQIGRFIPMPRATLRRRFGPQFIKRLNQALGLEEETILPVQPLTPYSERLPCLEPIVTAAGIEIALQRLLETLCGRLEREGKGLRTAVFKGYRVDGKLEQVSIGTSRASSNIKHLFKLFGDKLSTIEPDLGIELFILEAPKVEDQPPMQEKLWEGTGGLEDRLIPELVDRLAGRIGMNAIHRYVPDEHYWPERSFKETRALTEQPVTNWPVDRPRPVRLLRIPEPVTVAAPIPDYPPMHFRHKGILHTIKKADGPERIEAEWWIAEGEHRDYYIVEDEKGARYWLFRLGHYDGEEPHRWYLHGYFA